MIPTSSELPKRCPHCWGYAGVKTVEFKVRSYTDRMFDAETGGFSRIRDEGYQLFCRTCEEEILSKDIRESDMRGYDDEE